MQTGFNISTKYPSFRANIWVTGKANFKALPLFHLERSGKYVGYPWTVNKSVKMLDEGYTDGAIVCTSLFLQNGERGCLAHLKPQHCENTPNAVAEALTNAILKLREGKNDVKAILTGGCNFYQPCEDFYLSILDVLKQEKVEFSTVWGAMKSPLTDLFASAPEQKIIINHNRYDFNVKHKRDIEKIYSDVFLHKGDEFVF